MISDIQISPVKFDLIPDICPNTQSDTRYSAKYPIGDRIPFQISNLIPDIWQIPELIPDIWKYLIGYRISGQIFGRIPDIWSNTRSDTGYIVSKYPIGYIVKYPIGYQIPVQIPNRIPDTWPNIGSDTGYLVKYPAGYQTISGRIPDLRPQYLVGYQTISGRLTNIKTTGFPLHPHL